MESDSPEKEPVICYCLHDDFWYLSASIRSFKKAGRVFAFISRLAWNGTEGNWERCVEVAQSEGAEVILGDWSGETQHRRAALSLLKKLGYIYVITPDGDEIAEPQLLQSLIRIAKGALADRVSVLMDTYWKTAEYVIRPREKLEPVLMLNLLTTKHFYIREYEGGLRLLLDDSHGVLHHLSYAGPAERVARKIATWSHKHELIEGWLAEVWLAWDQDKTLRNLHPTHPPAYGFAERIQLPHVLQEVGLVATPVTPRLRPDGFPKLSVSIPLCGGTQDIKLCLQSLEKCKDLLHEVFVIDNNSPDGAGKFAEQFDFVTLIRNDHNRGFAAASNQGYAASTGDFVLFLNSDTVVPRSGLIELVIALASSGSIGAVGPYSNNISMQQQIPVTYTSLATLDLFANDLSERDVQDIDVDMLFGFCLAVRRGVLEEVGAFDERFGLGMFEDNDLCYRILRAGYKLKIASKSFVHHEGSKTLRRLPINPVKLLLDNEQIYRSKWMEDINSGYSSNLSGLGSDPVRFKSDKKPSNQLRSIERLKKAADISLCMIVKNEERVLSDCLRSAHHFFNEIIIVDTGSTDKTVEIAQGFDAKVIHYPWTDSFADARNQSLKAAKGKWIFWLDADDTLPWATGEAILNAALIATPEIQAFVVPVQFVDEGTESGTRVDHVKLFRNKSGLKFEGRIHEQILGSIRDLGGEIARLDAIVLHSGYDTSQVGQEKKRERDWKLLELELAERPDHPFVLFNCGMTAHYTGRHEKAVDWLTRCLEMSGSEESHLRKAYALLAVSYRELTRTDQAQKTLEDGLKIVPNDPELHFQLGLLLTQLGQLSEAKHHYLAINPDVSAHFSSIDLGILTHKRAFNLAAICLLEKDYQGAKYWFQHSITVSPTFAPTIFALFDAALENGDYKGGQEALAALMTLEGPSKNWGEMWTRYVAAVLGEKWVVPVLRQTCDVYPQSEAVGLQFARRLLDGGQQPQAEAILSALERAGSAEAAYLLGVCDIRRGQFTGALRHMRLANRLNPEHELTMQQLKGLELAVSQQAH